MGVWASTVEPTMGHFSGEFVGKAREDPAHEADQAATQANAARHGTWQCARESTRTECTAHGSAAVRTANGTCKAHAVGRYHRWKRW